MILPGFSAGFNIVVSFRFKNGYKWLLLDSIQILVKAVKEDVKKFLRILLILIIKLLLELCDYIFQFKRCNRFFSIKPKLLH